MPSSKLQNYLRMHRKHFHLSQEEVAFLLGEKGQNKGTKVCRDEKLIRLPKLKHALAYEAIYGLPVRELFAGAYQQIEREVTERARILALRKGSDTRKSQVFTTLASKGRN